MAKRLSSLFSLSRDTSITDLSHQKDTSSHRQDHSRLPRSNSPSRSKLRKSRTTSAAELPAPLVGSASRSPSLPPLLTERGPSRPTSSTDTLSVHGSRVGSPQSRTSSRSRPHTPNLIPSPEMFNPSSRLQTPESAKSNKRRTWLSGKQDSGKIGDLGKPKAWMAGLREQLPYDLTPLLCGERVIELWDDHGDTVIYLYPRTSGRGPSFQLDSAMFAHSRALQTLRAEAPGTTYPVEGHSTGLSMSQSGFTSRSVQPLGIQPHYHGRAFGPHPGFAEEKHVHLPLGLDHELADPRAEPKRDDLELVVLYRNFFAFLLGGGLVSTPRQPSLYSIFTGISTILKRYGFTNPDGSTWGDVPSRSFARYSDDLRLADVRSSREKTIEAIVIGEHLRSWPLYNEGFVHAAGRLDELKSINNAKFNKISPITMNRLERAHLEAEQRLATVRSKLEEFDFPSMFAGIANSQTAVEAKLIRFKDWKAAFMEFRKFSISFYRRKYGAWPPNASSKKNPFEESGLNRLLLKELYGDFTALYDMLANRASLTPRAADSQPVEGEPEANDINETIQHALRRVESEYDRATPPVLPPIPFDTPIIPAFAQSFNRNHVVTPRNAALNSKPLKNSEVNEVLLGSYNRDSIKASTWIQDFFDYERRLGHGKTLNEIIDLRCGQWLFLYAVLQTLPMVVVDARDIKFTDGVEYFLCSPPRGGRPWMKEDTAQSRAWHNVASGGDLVSLPAELIDHSVEGIYRRSHCWTTATKWASSSNSEQFQETSEPRRLPQSKFAPRNASSDQPDWIPAISQHLTPSASSHNSPLIRPTSQDSGGRTSGGTDRSSPNPGLGSMAPPPLQARRPVSMYNPDMTFDAILGTDSQNIGKKGKN